VADNGGILTPSIDAINGYRLCCVALTFKYVSLAQAVKASVEEVLANGFDRYMPAHGAIIKTRCARGDPEPFHRVSQAVHAGPAEFEAPDYCLLFIATVAVGAWWLAGSVAGGRRPIVYVRGEEGIHRMYN